MCLVFLLLGSCILYLFAFFVFFKQKTAYEMRISDWSSDVCSSDLKTGAHKAKSRASAALDPRLATILPQILLDEIPVRERPEVLEKVRSRIAVVDVVSVFPNVAGQQRLLVLGKRVFGVRCAGDRQRSEEKTSELQFLMRIS